MYQLGWQPQTYNAFLMATEIAYSSSSNTGQGCNYFLQAGSRQMCSSTETVTNIHPCLYLSCKETHSFPHTYQAATPCLLLKKYSQKTTFRSTRFHLLRTELKNSLRFCNRTKVSNLLLSSVWAVSLPTQAHFRILVHKSVLYVLPAPESAPLTQLVESGRPPGQLVVFAVPPHIAWVG